jgi:hypothetical protein
MVQRPCGLESGHITGARFADLVSDFSDPQAPFAFTRPTAARLASAAGAIGLTNRREIVVYRRHVGEQEGKHHCEPDFWLSPLKGGRWFPNSLESVGFGVSRDPPRPLYVGSK